ncbi:MAG: trypsin-like serine protease [Anaerocolumna aminovalerica]|uniref:trypsin-like serine protease n=1 Tax=Anaerocolumna aminovalerica TaxID=1527 RepID=UPI00290F8826|nr:trypsin-like serine protease [Anaerocolumna aminovalerica]MDU6263190.1 trypsin-like serine protease [Anaerocolumna aminovalerica]
MKNQEKALAAYEVLFSTFSILNNEIIYPDEYAGEYIENNKLVIQLSGATEEKKNEYRELLKDYDCVEIRDVMYSSNYLNGLLNEIEKDIKIYSPSNYGIDTKINSIVIEVPKTNYDLASQYLATQNNLWKATDNVPIKIIEGEYSRTEAINLIGGNMINHNGYSFTLGYGGRAYGYNVYASSGHNTIPGYPVYYNGSQIGTLAGKQFNDNAVGDFSIITINDNYSVTNLVKLSDDTTAPISAVYNNPPVGTTLFKYGAFGQYAVATVTKVNQTVYYAEQGVSIKGLTKTSIDSGTSQGGDSGGPYYLWRDYHWEFCGVHSGSNGVTTNFTPPVYITGFTPRTN